ncbi:MULTISPECIES: MarR family winged helix-turn-helix transcriptional regulator [Streptomyces]|uniref:MarR family transcriptional regulator n=1 Tax=Streptomyces griseorubiginosus TaxID=67304 RepID=A0A101RWQ5_9ACTN|nr:MULTISPECIES: MarR family winged helix-turn-helix transcriptional regulator [Streptomyces]KUN63111.1 MarR family transcriptional regulator [Streptomyces griseorubiginosus]TCR16378.1 DNA-binding MarR family transcriptional regulator [Streptomyces sp. BK205]
MATPNQREQDARPESGPDQRRQDARPESGTGGAPTDLYAFAVRLRRMNGEINRLVQGFAGDHGLHATDIQALGAIMDADEPMTPSGLRRHLGLTSGAVTACVDRLERAGHIRRVRESADRRVVHLRYEPDARAAARSYFRPLAEATEAARSRFGEQELSVVVRFLEALNEELAEARPGGR